MSGLATVLLLAVSSAGGHGRAGGAAAPSSATTEPSGSDEVTDSTDVATSAAAGRESDGVLTIGTLLPVTGPGNEIGLAGLNAVNVGIREINDDGGVLGQPVRLVNADEGTTIADARAGINKLVVDNNVDAVIGPASSHVALEVLDELMAPGVVVCSPTTTALSLNDYPDRDLFFRTVPSDSLSAQAMAVYAGNTGVDTYAVVYLDDQFGRPFAQQMTNRLTAPEVAEILERPFPADATPEELAEFATRLAESGPRTIVLIADAERGWAMLQALATVFPVDPPFILVNDALRSPPSTEIVADLPEEFRNAIVGLSPTVPPVVPPEPPGAYATNSLDCLNLIALAAVEAGTDDPAAIAEEMLNVSVVGSLCNSFRQCRGIAEQDRNINYQGANAIDFSERGDPARGRISSFSFDVTGLAIAGAPATITEVTESD